MPHKPQKIENDSPQTWDGIYDGEKVRNEEEREGAQQHSGAARPP